MNFCFLKFIHFLSFLVSAILYINIMCLCHTHPHTYPILVAQHICFPTPCPPFSPKNTLNVINAADTHMGQGIIH